MLNNMCLRGLFICFNVFISLSQVCSQNENLILVKKSDNILVYKEKDAHENINRIVARTTVDAAYMKVLCLIKDFEHQKEWIYSNAGAHCIDSISPTNWIYYGVSETPWPFKDRDAVANVHLIINRGKQELIIHSTASSNPILTSPERVRIQMLDSKWKLRKLKKGTRIELDLLVDVGGNVPVWLINMFAANGPFNTFKNMIKELKRSNEIKDCGYSDFFE